MPAAAILRKIFCRPLRFVNPMLPMLRQLHFVDRSSPMSIGSVTPSAAQQSSAAASVQATDTAARGQHHHHRRAENQTPTATPQGTQTATSTAAKSSTVDKVA